MIEIVFFGDIVGAKALDKVLDTVQILKNKDVSQFFIANGENAAEGFGITEGLYKRLIDGGIDCVTLGNHAWDKKDIKHFIGKADKLVRPLNMPNGCPGSGYQIISPNNTKLAVINLLGRSLMMNNIDCPFRTVDSLITSLQSQGINNILVDIHAETTSEKYAMGYYLDGRVSAVLGTHTHVPTDDRHILPNGTAYTTDVGACMGIDSIIGMQKETTLKRFLTGINHKTIVSQNPATINAVKMIVDEKTGKALSISKL